MNLFDCTLRDGANVVGDGFSGELTVSIVKGLLANGITEIELGNAKGLSAYEAAGADRALTDREYFELVKPYTGKGSLGMFQTAGYARAEDIRAAADCGLSFLRVGSNAGDGEKAVKAVQLVKAAGLTCRYSLMKAYLLNPGELAAEARMLESAGVDKITVMDSAGTMFPEEAAAYVTALKQAVRIPVGFHGHSNLGLSQANALAAAEAGADEIDCGLLGMARSAGNCATELAAAALMKKGLLPEIDFYGLLDYLEKELIPLMNPYHYHAAVKPVDLILGLAGAHSSFQKLFEKVAAEEHVSVYRLITEVSVLNRKSPDEALMRRVAAGLR